MSASVTTLSASGHTTIARLEQRGERGWKVIHELTGTANQGGKLVKRLRKVALGFVHQGEASFKDLRIQLHRLNDAGKSAGGNDV
jgi:hypothetical protein